MLPIRCTRHFQKAFSLLPKNGRNDYWTREKKKPIYWQSDKTEAQEEWWTLDQSIIKGPFKNAKCRIHILFIFTINIQRAYYKVEFQMHKDKVFKIRHTSGIQNLVGKSLCCSHDCCRHWCPKGQLISKKNFGVFKCPKKPMNFFPGFLPQPLKRGQIKKIRTLYTAKQRILF